MLTKIITLNDAAVSTGPHLQFSFLNVSRTKKANVCNRKIKADSFH